MNDLESPTQPEVRPEANAVIQEKALGPEVKVEKAEMNLEMRTRDLVIPERRRAGILKSTTEIEAITEEDQDQNWKKSTKNLNQKMTILILRHLQDRTG